MQTITEEEMIYGLWIIVGVAVIWYGLEWGQAAFLPSRLLEGKTANSVYESDAQWKCLGLWFYVFLYTISGLAREMKWHTHRQTVRQRATHTHTDTLVESVQFYCSVCVTNEEQV